MKGISIGIFCFCLTVLFSFLGLKIYRGNQYFKIFIASWGISVVLYGILYWLTPAHLYIYSPLYLEPNTSIDSVNGFLWLTLLFHLFWDGMYMFFFAGFSTGLLARLFDAKEQGLSRDELLDYYKVQGGNMLIRSRMINLERGRYLCRVNSSYELTPKGVFFARAALFLKKIFYLELGG